MPTIGSTSKPAYVYDAGTDTWIPIGPGEHTHQYIDKNVITTTGDIIYASSANTPARLGIGSANQVLRVSSGGIPEWAAAASGTTFAGCYLYNSTNTTVSNNSYTQLTFNSEQFDTDNYHSTSSNTSRITIPSGKAGYYLLQAQVMFAGATNTTGGRAANMQINGSGISYMFLPPASGSAGDGQGAQQTVVRYLAVGDYVEMNAYQNSGGTMTLDRTVTNTFLIASYLGA